MFIEIYHLMVSFSPYILVFALYMTLSRELDAYGNLRSYPAKIKPRVKIFGHAVTFFIEFSALTIISLAFCSCGLTFFKMIYQTDFSKILITIIFLLTGFICLALSMKVTELVEDNDSNFAKKVQKIHSDYSKNSASLSVNEQRSIVIYLRNLYKEDLRENFWKIRIVRYE